VTDIQDPRAIRNNDGGPSQPVRRDGAAVLSLAGWFDRALTWGLEPTEREEILRERESDRYEHVTDPDASMVSVVTRSVWSSLGDVWYRFVETEASALPLAIMFAIAGMGALVDTFTSDVSAMVGALQVITAIGYFALAAAGLRQPRVLQRVWLIPGLVLASFGTIAGAFVVPAAPNSGPFGWFFKLALAGLGIGLAIVAIALIRDGGSRKWIIRGGTVMWGSALVLAIGGIGWAIVDVPIYSTRLSSLMVAFAGVVGAAVITRMRNIEVA